MPKRGDHGVHCMQISARVEVRDSRGIQRTQFAFVDGVEPGKLPRFGTGNLELELDRVDQSKLRCLFGEHPRSTFAVYELPKEAHLVAQVWRILAGVIKKGFSIYCLDARIVEVDAGNCLLSGRIC